MKKSIKLRLKDFDLVVQCPLSIVIVYFTETILTSRFDDF